VLADVLIQQCEASVGVGFYIEVFKGAATQKFHFYNLDFKNNTCKNCQGLLVYLQAGKTGRGVPLVLVHNTQISGTYGQDYDIISIIDTINADIRLYDTSFT
jgi:hypothetical protein